MLMLQIGVGLYCKVLFKDGNLLQNFVIRFWNYVNWQDSFNDQTKSSTTECSKGMACVFSLKNPTYPEFICLSSCAIHCIDVNLDHPHMIAVGLMDGNIAVYNLQNETQDPFYKSDAINGKHRNVVNQVNHVFTYVIYPNCWITPLQLLI